MTSATQSAFEFRGDVCASRHQGNENSVAAFNLIKGTREWHHAEILERVTRVEGLTSKEYMREVKAESLNCISGRFSELEALNKIYQDKKEPRREGCGIWRLQQK